MAPEPDIPALEANRLTKSYGRHHALVDCTLTIPRGSVVGLVGPNGAGKSTLMHLACGLVQPTSGSVRVLGEAPGESAAHLARVGFVAQDTPTYGSFTVAEHLRMGRHLNRVWDGTLAQGRIEALGLDPSRRARRLSGGQRAQLALTLAAAKRPDLLILDEPAAALDPVSRRSFMESLTSFVRGLDASAVLSSHLLEDVERTCDHLVVLVGGRVRASGAVPELVATHFRVDLPAAEVDAVRARPDVDVIATELARGTGVGGSGSVGVGGSQSAGVGGAAWVRLAVRSDTVPRGVGWSTQPLGLADIVLSYLTADGPVGPTVGVGEGSGR